MKKPTFELQVGFIVSVQVPTASGTPALAAVQADREKQHQS